MKTKLILSSILAAILVAAGPSGCAAGKCNHCQQAALAAQAKITQAQAQQTALAKVPNGTVKEGELEKENGKLIWSFDIATPDSKNITEVAVDALTGEIVTVEQETPAQQKQEKD